MKTTKRIDLVSCMASTISRVRNSGSCCPVIWQTAEQPCMFSGGLTDQLPGFLHGIVEQAFGARRHFGLRRSASDDRFFFMETAPFNTNVVGRLERKTAWCARPHPSLNEHIGVNKSGSMDIGVDVRRGKEHSQQGARPAVHREEGILRKQG